MKKLLLLSFVFLLSLNLFPDNVRTVAVFDLTARDSMSHNADILGLEHLLKVAGIPYIVTPYWDTASRYHVVLATNTFFLHDSTFIPTITTAEEDSIKSWIFNGGVFVAPNMKDSALYACFGVSSVTWAENRHHIIFNTSLGDPTMRWINDSLEINISLGRDNLPTVISSRAFVTTTATTLATYESMDSASITRNDWGLGKAYALGVSYKNMITLPQMSKDEEAQRTWSNGFEPTSDAWILFIKGICINSIPNSVWLHTSPFDSKSSLMITHDIDAQTSYDTMHYYADYEKSLGISTFYFCTTHYVQDGWLSPFYNQSDISRIQYVMSMGHTIGCHSVSHVWDFDSTYIPFDNGIGLGNYTTTNYQPYAYPYNVAGTPHSIGVTVLGETQLARNLLQQDLGVPIRSFRSGYLCNNRDLVRGLDTVGYTYNSTYSANDVLTNFPYRDHKFRNYRGPMSKVWELPMTLSDVFASDHITGDNYLQKEAIWISVVNKNMANNAPTVILIHPTRYYKLFAEQLLINQLDPKVDLVNFETFADYWVQRDSLRFTTTLQNGVLTIWVAHSQAALLNSTWPSSPISFVVDNGQSLTSILLKDSLTGTPVANIQSNWDNNGKLVHFGYYISGVNSKEAAGNDAITVNCYPNPFSNITTIEVWQKETGMLNISVYNVYGQLIKTIANEKRSPGIYHDRFDAEGISTGTYFCKITTGNKSVVKKLMVTN